MCDVARGITEKTLARFTRERPKSRMPKEGRSPKRPRKKSARAPADTNDALKRREAVTAGEQPEEEVRRVDPSERPGFVPRTLDKSVIAIPLLRVLVKEDQSGAAQTKHHIVIDLHLEFPGGRERARDRVRELVDMLPTRADRTRPVLRETSQYMFASLYGDEIRALVRLDRGAGAAVAGPVKRRAKKKAARADEAIPRAIFRIWPDFPV